MIRIWLDRWFHITETYEHDLFNERFAERFLQVYITYLLAHHEALTALSPLSPIHPLQRPRTTFQALQIALRRVEHYLNSNTKPTAQKLAQLVEDLPATGIAAVDRFERDYVRGLTHPAALVVRDKAYASDLTLEDIGIVVEYNPKRQIRLRVTLNEAVSPCGAS